MAREHEPGRSGAMKERIARRPFVAWAGHAVLFASFALLLQVVRGDELDWVRALTMAAIVAAAVVIGSVVGSRMGRRSQG